MVTLTLIVTSSLKLLTKEAKLTKPLGGPLASLDDG